ncbi:hypothetical protein I7I53_12141 [Histoplasma capsulatum var. duboisii H88]|uniref:Uncharacterized protein n=1 Tax=Ajellomyces capsulatus (strain H88) TaxID=544711 RepID=A0A8A1M0X3_AJEC8|nr:hypothetical protein I7I53_12141 [Histoplasma capsulatum var. duboisii H88]
MATFRFASARTSLLVPRAHQNLPYHSFFNLTAAQLQVSKPPFPAAVSALLRRSFVTDRKQPEDPVAYEIENDPDGRSSINTERHEYSKSGSDNAVAEQRAAWDLSYITPEMVREASLDEAMHDGHSKAGPLEVSPANRDVSQYTDEAARRGWVEKGPSRRVSPPKGMKVDYSGTVVIEKKETLIKLPTK